MDVKNIIAHVAESHGVSYDECYADMKEAVLAGFHSNDPEVRKVWDSIHIQGEEPTPEEVIQAIYLMLSDAAGPAC